jgi:hypothetical protein
VIDYGYTIKGDSLEFIRVSLQRSWPVRKFRYRWKHYQYVGASYSVHRAEALDVRVQRDRSSVLVEASNLTPVPQEPYMPPDYEARASVSLYYLHRGDSYDDYWNDQAKRIDKMSRTSSSDELIRQVLSAVEGDRGADLTAKLKNAYDWIVSNVENPLFVRADAGGRMASPGGMPSMDQLFIDVARRLGAEAFSVLAPDRRKSAWDRHVNSMHQLPVWLVAVRSPGASWDQVLTVDLDSGLPFGELPWWVTGVEGMLATAQGARSVFLKPSSPRSNVSRISVEQEFSGDHSRLIARWHRISEGQSGLDEARQLGDTSEKNRKERVARMCGLGPDVEVIRSESKLGYPPLVARLDCESHGQIGTTDPDSTHYELIWAGPWVGPVPDLPPGRRVNPVVFAFPRVDFLELTVKAPSGFRPEAAREGASFAGPYGKYRLVISVTQDGYKLERALALFPVAVPPAEYDSLRSFLADVRRADRTTLAFGRAEPQP